MAINKHQHRDENQERYFQGEENDWEVSGDSLVIEDCSLHYGDSKCAIKKIGHLSRLGDITCSSYSFNHCDFISQGQICSIDLRYVLQELEAQLRCNS